MSAFMLTINAREHYLSGYEVMANQMDINDIAWSLSQLNRFTGHATRPYSVAEHSLLVADLAKREGKSAVVQLACLMHDAHEAFCGDLSSPGKQAVGVSWANFEHRQADIVRRQFGLVSTFAVYRQLIGHYDLVALATERRDLTKYDSRRNRAWEVLDAQGHEVPPASPTVVNLNNLTRCNSTWRDWRDRFLDQFFTLSRIVHAAIPTALE